MQVAQNNTEHQLFSFFFFLFVFSISQLLVCHHFKRDNLDRTCVAEGGLALFF